MTRTEKTLWLLIASLSVACNFWAGDKLIKLHHELRECRSLAAPVAIMPKPDPRFLKGE